MIKIVKIKEKIEGNFDLEVCGGESDSNGKIKKPNMSRERAGGN